MFTGAEGEKRVVYLGSFFLRVPLVHLGLEINPHDVRNEDGYFSQRMHEIQ